MSNKVCPFMSLKDGNAFQAPSYEWCKENCELYISEEEGYKGCAFKVIAISLARQEVVA